jgi:hypothetical protein
MSKGDLKGGVLKCVIDDARKATVSDSWRDQRCTIELFIEKWKFVLKDGVVEQERLAC